EIIYEIAFIESALDDPEHISLDGYKDKLDEKVSNLSDRVEKLLSTADNGRLMKEGISTVIVGKPNAGKSSLLNIMVGEERAIVTDIAGTTRDVLQESIKLHGIGLNIIDTAGIRTTEDVVEKIGVEKAKKYANEADLILYVVDASVALDDSDREIITLLEDKNVIILLNKSDLTAAVEESDLIQVIDELVPGHKKIEMIRTSTKDNTGIDVFENVIKEMFFKGNLKNNNQIVITNMRHKEALKNAYDSLQMVKRSLADDMPEDFYSIDLMSAYSSLGFIIGEEVDDDLVNEIFTKFCMGK
ncbi:MAG: GTP-binding protein, partial [Clostridia bacterium]|nr:GTP-binding protein [Clostridia bacterium]